MTTEDIEQAQEARETLKDVLPREFAGYVDTPAYRLRDVEVVARHDVYEGGKRWPGTHRNVVFWYELANGNAVGWNENVAVGWSFPVLSKAALAKSKAA